MERIHSDTELDRYLTEAMQATEDRPILDRFLSGHRTGCRLSL